MSRFSEEVTAVLLTLRRNYFDMKVWSYMFAVNIQSFSIQQLNWISSAGTLDYNQLFH